MYSCETPHPQNYSIASKLPLPYENFMLRWHIVNFSPDLPEHEQIMIFEDVFAHFNYQLWPLRHLSTEHMDDAYIRIAFVEKDLIVKDYLRKELFQCPYDFNINPSTLAVAYPRQGSKLDGWIFVNEEYMWSMIHANGKYSLQKVLIHEVAHLFGLGHSEKKHDIMAPVYDPANLWTSDSITGINAIHRRERMAALISVPEAEIFRLSTHDERNKSSCSLFVKRAL